MAGEGRAISLQGTAQTTASHPERRLEPQAALARQEQVEGSLAGENSSARRGPFDSATGFASETTGSAQHDRKLLRLFGFEEESRQRRQRQAQRERPAVGGMSIGMHASQVPHATSAVFLGVAVQKLAPEATGGHAYPVSVARYGSEIADDHNFIGRRPALAQQ